MNQLCKRENLIVNGYMVIWEEGEREREREETVACKEREAKLRFITCHSQGKHTSLSS